MLKQITVTKPRTKSATIFSQTKKLRKMSVHDSSISNLLGTIQDLVDQAPQLQFVVLSNVKGQNNYEMIGNTAVIQQKFLSEIRNFEDLKKIGPVLQSSNYIHGLLDIFRGSFTLTKDICEYLFRELKLDINGYFLKEDKENRFPFLARLFRNSPLSLSREVKY